MSDGQRKLNDTVFQIQEVHIDRTRNAEVGRSDWYEPSSSDKGQLYREWQAEYGRCTSKIYQDSKDGKTYHVGYVFVARVPYGADCMASNRTNLPPAKREDTYLCEMWCSWRTVKRDPRAVDRGLVSIPLAEQYEEARP